MPNISPAAVERVAEALDPARAAAGMAPGPARLLEAREVLTAAHDELIQAWIRSRLDDPETIENMAKVIDPEAFTPGGPRYLKGILQQQARTKARAAIGTLRAEDE